MIRSDLTAVSLEGCRLIGRGAKGDVYRYDNELVIKVYNENNTYQDVEREITLARKALILGMPTVISFGIVSTGERYGAMFEMVDSETISECISESPGQVESYAKIMADLARTIHGADVSGEGAFPDAMGRMRDYIRGGIGCEDEYTAADCMKLLDGLFPSKTLLHGDFHTGNVFIQGGEPLLIDMDRVSVGHPIAELSDMYYFYVTMGETDPAVVEEFMGFDYDTSKEFFRCFMKYYLDSEDEERIREVEEKASLIGYSRNIRRIRKKESLTEADRKVIEDYRERIRALTEKFDTLNF